MEMLEKEPRKRLDIVIHDKRPDLSRSLIQSWIKEGLVFIDGKVVSKPGLLVNQDVNFILQLDQPEYVSRSGIKLKQALQEFSIDVTGLTVLDVGLSTGGFTDCLLQHGAAKVFGVDVGSKQVHPKIASDERVVVMEQTDIKNCLGKIPAVDMIVVDISFISVTKVIYILEQLIKPAGKLVVLIKPQFEATKNDLARGGLIKNAVLRKQLVGNVVAAFEHSGFGLQGVVESLTVGGDGNIEFLGYFVKK